MAVILALETSSTICSVALYQQEQLLALSELQIEKSHSSHITVLIDQMLQNCHLTLSDLAAVAVSGGPGSYTGLRIGSATAKGLCYALEIPLIEVSTLYALAHELIQVIPAAQQYLFCPMIDARRMEVYSCLVNSDLQELMPIAPIILSETTFQDYLAKQPVVFFGSGAAKYQKMIEHFSNTLFVNSIALSARSIGALAVEKYEKQIFEDVAYYEPFYLKDVYITTSSKANK